MLGWRAAQTGVARSMISTKRFGFAGFMLAFSTLLATVLSFGQARAEGIRLDALQIPAEIAGVYGRAPLQLEAIVVRPDDGQPHPLAVINHGSPRDAEDRPKMSPYGQWAEAVAFARRGWVAVAFLRRGYGRSQGAWAETYGGCSDPDYAKAGLAGASDIAAVAKFMSSQPYVSKGKWISVGVSAGAFDTVALTAMAPAETPTLIHLPLLT